MLETSFTPKRKNGKISEDELKVAIDKVFEVFDIDKNGVLDIGEVTTLLTKSLGTQKVTEKEIN